MCTHILTNLNIGQDVANARKRIWTNAYKVAKFYPLQLAVRMGRYGSLININPDLIFPALAIEYKRPKAIVYHARKRYGKANLHLRKKLKTHKTFSLLFCHDFYPYRSTRPTYSHGWQGSLFSHMLSVRPLFKSRKTTENNVRDWRDCGSVRVDQVCCCAAKSGLKKNRYPGKEKKKALWQLAKAKQQQFDIKKKYFSLFFKAWRTAKSETFVATLKG